MMFNYGKTFDPNFMKPHDFNNMNQFIHGYYMDENDIKICDELISYFKNTPEAKIAFNNNNIDTCFVFDIKLRAKYNAIMTKMIANYYKMYPFAFIENAGFTEHLAINCYDSGKGRTWSEELLPNPTIRYRHFGFNTFLTDNGEESVELNFFHQKISLKTEKGLTFIWPENWTHNNSLSNPNNKENYVLSGYISIEEPKKQKPVFLDSDEPLTYNFDGDKEEMA